MSLFVVFFFVAFKRLFYYRVYRNYSISKKAPKLSAKGRKMIGLSISHYKILLSHNKQTTPILEVTINCHKHVLPSYPPTSSDVADYVGRSPKPSLTTVTFFDHCSLDEGGGEGCGEACLPQAGRIKTHKPPNPTPPRSRM